MPDVVFVYGTLTHPDTRKKVVGRALTGIQDSLAGYRLEYQGMLPYPAATEAPDSLLAGIRLDHITDDDLRRLDTYEGIYFVRIQVMLTSGIQAWLYVGNPRYTSLP